MRPLHGRVRLPEQHPRKKKKSTRAMTNTTFKFNRKISLKLHAVFMQAEADRIAALPNSAASATPAMAKAAASSEKQKPSIILIP